MKLTIRAALLTASVLATPAYAEDAVVSGQDTIVVIATRTPQPLSEVASPVSVLTATDLQDRQSTSVFDGLRRLPGVDIGGGPRVQGSEVTIRGLTGRQVLLTVDGARIAPPWAFGTALNVDPTFLANAEVGKGASSALYGGGSLGGVLALRTVTADDLLRDGATVGVRGGADYHSASDNWRGFGQVYGKAGQIDAFAGLSYRESGPIRQGNGVKLEPADYNATAMLGKVGWTIADRYRLQLSHQRFRSNDFGPNNPQADATFPFLQQHHTEENSSILSFTGRNDAGVEDLRVTLYSVRQRNWSDPNVADGLTASEDITVNRGLSAQKSFDIALGSTAHRLTLGGEYYRERTASTEDGLESTISPAGHQDVTSLFGQDEINMLPWLRAIGTVRWDQFKTHLNSGAFPDKTDERVSYKGTLAVEPVKGLMFYGSYGEAFRAPTVGELYQDFHDPFAFANFASNTALKPELAREFNLGFNFSHRGLLSSDDSLLLRGSWYRADVDNMIDTAVIGTFVSTLLVGRRRPILQYQNVARARRNGGEIELSYVNGPIDLGLSYSRIRNSDRDTGVNLFSPPSGT